MQIHCTLHFHPSRQKHKPLIDCVVYETATSLLQALVCGNGILWASKSHKNGEWPGSGKGFSHAAFEDTACKCRRFRISLHIKLGVDPSNSFVE